MNIFIGCEPGWCCSRCCRTGQGQLISKVRLVYIQPVCFIWWNIFFANSIHSLHVLRKLSFDWIRSYCWFGRKLVINCYCYNIIRSIYKTNNLYFEVLTRDHFLPCTFPCREISFQTSPCWSSGQEQAWPACWPCGLQWPWPHHTTESKMIFRRNCLPTSWPV